MNTQLENPTKILTVTVPGDLLSTNANAVREELFRLLEPPAGTEGDWLTLRIDLTKAQMIDSVGLNLLVAVVRTLKARNRRTQAVISNPNILRTFQFTRLDQQLEVIRN